jgi:hypothetical protein
MRRDVIPSLAHGRTKPQETNDRATNNDIKSHGRANPDRNFAASESAPGKLDSFAHEVSHHAANGYHQQQIGHRETFHRRPSVRPRVGVGAHRPVLAYNHHTPSTAGVAGRQRLGANFIDMIAAWRGGAHCFTDGGGGFDIDDLLVISVTDPV